MAAVARTPAEGLAQEVELARKISNSKLVAHMKSKDFICLAGKALGLEYTPFDCFPYV